MDSKHIILLQQRDFGQKMNASFEFVSRNFLPLFKSVLFIAGPPALVSGIANGVFQSRLLATGSLLGVGASFGRYLAWEYLLVMVFSFITYFLAYASVAAFMTLYEEKGSSSEITPGLVWSKLSENIAASAGGMIAYIIICIVGVVIFVIPGIYLGIALQFFMMITVREKLPAIEALKKSQKLIFDKWWSTFGLLMIMSFVAGIISIVFQLPVLITTVMTTLGVAVDPTTMKTWMIVGSAFSILGSSVVQGLVWVSLGFQYYNLVERQTGSGLMADIDSLGSGDWERSKDEER